MPFIETNIKDLLVFEPVIFPDDRGYFFETFNQKSFEERGIDINFVQDNQSLSAFGVLRGLHYQKPPFEQAKLVRVLAGEVLDVAVDIRKESETYGKWFSILLSAENKKQLFIPRGFAHGFVVLSESAEFCYKCDNFYSTQHESGIRFDDSSLNIDWHLNPESIKISQKDRILSIFNRVEKKGLI